MLRMLREEKLEEGDAARDVNLEAAAAGKEVVRGGRWVWWRGCGRWVDGMVGCEGFGPVGWRLWLSCGDGGCSGWKL